MPATNSTVCDPAAVSDFKPPESPTVSHQQTPEPEAALLVGDGVLAEEAAFSLTHGLHGHVPLCFTAQ